MGSGVFWCVSCVFQVCSRCVLGAFGCVLFFCVSPSTLAEAPESNNDEANAFAAVHAKILRHLRNHALRTLLCNKGGADRALCLTAWPTPLASSGYVRSWARASAMPHLHADLHLCGACRCTPLNKGNLTSILDPLPVQVVQHPNRGP